MKQRHNPSITKMFKGFRMVRKRVGEKYDSVPVMPRLRLTKGLLKRYEKLEVLTKLQNDLVAEQLNKCTEKSSPIHVAKLCAVLEKYTEEKLEEQTNEK